LKAPQAAGFLPQKSPATHCNTLQHTATHCNTLQHTATHCNTLQHTATLHCTTTPLRFVGCLHCWVDFARQPCITLQPTASVLQCVAVRKTALHHPATHSKCVAVCCSPQDSPASHCNPQQVCCSVLQSARQPRITLQHTAKHCNTPLHYHIATIPWLPELLGRSRKRDLFVQCDTHK